MNSTRQIAALPSLEARFAARLAGALSDRSQSLPHDVTERLRFAREQAMSRARQARLQTGGGTTLAGVSSQGTAILGGLTPWWQRAASLLPLLVLVSGLVMIERWAVKEQVLAAAEIDAQLLSDVLPPAAYSDPGFGEFLRAPPSQ